MAEEAPKFEVIDNASVTESYANRLISASFDGGSVVMTLGVMRFGQGPQNPKDGPPPPVHVTARLVMPPAAAVDVMNVLNKLLSTMSQIQRDNAASKPDTAKAETKSSKRD